MVLASDGRQALDLAVRERPDLALLDVMMPHLDGFAVLEQLRKDRDSQRMPVIMLTARDESAARVRGLKGGANDYVAKPFDHEELLARVANLLESFQAQREANPLTGLPGNQAIEREVQRRLEARAPFAAMYIDIDRFKSFNDHYGYTRGDRAIDLLGHVLCDGGGRRRSRGRFRRATWAATTSWCCAPPSTPTSWRPRWSRPSRPAASDLHDPDDWPAATSRPRTRTGEPVRACPSSP